MLDKILKKRSIAALSTLAIAHVAAQGSMDSRLSTLEAQVDAITQKNVRGTTQATSVTSRPMIDGAELYAIADALYWKPTQDDLTYTFRNHEEVDAQGNVNGLFSGNAKDLKPDWNVGFRLGLGYNMPYDQWDLELVWTNYRNNSHSSTDAPPKGYLLSALSPIGVGGGSGLWNAEATLKLRYDTLDLELGRAFYTSKALSFRPFVGARLARINERFNAKSTGIINPIFGRNLFTKFQNLFHAWGARAGLDMNWRFGSHWGIIGRAAGSIVYGRYHVSSIQTASSSISGFEYDVSNGFHRVRFNAEGMAGIEWDAYVNRNRAHLFFSLGYEITEWFDYNHTRNFFNGALYVQKGGDLGLQGVTFSARVDF